MDNLLKQQKIRFMSKQYHYIDPDYTYTDPETGVLRNLANITDPDTLIIIESGAVTKRIADLQANPIKIKNPSTLLNIHKYLFQDIYLWAGKLRMIAGTNGRIVRGTPKKIIKLKF